MTKSPTILVIDDDSDLRYSLQRVLNARNYTVIEAGSGEQGIEVAKQQKPTVILLDNRMEGISGIETLQHLRHSNPEAMVILMTAFGTTQTAIEAMKFGAFDYIIKPFDIKRILKLIEKAVAAFEDLNTENQRYVPLINSDDYQEGIVGNSEPMQEVFKVVGQVAASDATVMITGESGTGKELVARCIFQHSHRSSKPFIAVNCAAIPEDLIESELFGHEKGSFTGATAQRIGKFELCDGGTIFLDEIGDMALSTQTKILRALQEGEIQRVGGTSTIQVDVRMIAATNKDLEKMVEEKSFREDLYYRLNVVRLRLPALRQRLEDVPALVDFMLQRMGKEQKSQARNISNEAAEILQVHNWPGNVRELENVIYRSAVVAKGETILKKDLPDELLMSVTQRTKALESGGIPPVTPPPFAAEVTPGAVAGTAPQAAVGTEVAPAQAEVGAAVGTEQKSSLEMTYDELYRLIREEVSESILQEIEKQMIIRSLKETKGNQVKTSNILGITRATLRKRIDQLNLRY